MYKNFIFLLKRYIIQLKFVAYIPSIKIKIQHNKKENKKNRKKSVK